MKILIKLFADFREGKLNEVIEGCAIRLEYTAAKEMKLLEIYNKLKVIIEFNLLLEIGVNDSNAHKLIEKYIQYNVFD